MHCNFSFWALFALVLGITTSTAALDTANPKRQKYSRSVPTITNDGGAQSSTTFDYIIVGAGLAGLTVANRLSEDSTKNILVIEAGRDTRKNEKVVGLGSYGQAFGDSQLNWNFQTVSQALSDGATKNINAGRGLGGSTSINGAAWNAPESSQIDAIGAYGNEGWNWNDLVNYMKKSQNYHAPGTMQSGLGATWDASSHGTSGPVDICFTDSMFTGPQQGAFIEGIKQALDVDKIVDSSNGHSLGVAYTPNTILPGSGEARTRVSAATAYLNPIENKRPNLTILTGWRAARINFASGDGDKQADSVTIQSSRDGPSYDVKVSRQVIVAAGAIRSPMLLEHSGIGSIDVLQTIGVEKQVELPGVGKNLNEQEMSVLGAPANSDFGGEGPSNAIAMVGIKHIMSNASEVESQVRSQLDAWAQDAFDKGAVASKEGLLTQYRAMADGIFTKDWPVAEMFFDSGFPNGGLGQDIWLLLPFSRGFTHSQSSSTWDSPILSPRYWTVPFDMDVQVNTLRSGRRVFQSEAMKAVIGGDGRETQPGFDSSNVGIPDGTNHGLYARWRKFILDNYGSVHHPLGTCAMMPQDQGGVVDSEFKVYGTSNVRTVDASILPNQVSAHLSSLLYGIAEKAAATIIATQ